MPVVLNIIEGIIATALFAGLAWLAHRVKTYFDRESKEREELRKKVDALSMDVANLREDIRHRVAGDLAVFKSVEELQDLVADLLVIVNDARLISLHAPISYHKPEADRIRKSAEDILDGRE